MDGWMNHRWMDEWVFKQTIITKLPIALLASMQTCLNDKKKKKNLYCRIY